MAPEMLLERVFAIGGGLCLAAGGLLLGSLAYYGGLAVFPPADLGGGLFLLFDAFFLHVGREAARDRRALLALADDTPASSSCAAEKPRS